jgi:hypothetical protein
MLHGVANLLRTILFIPDPFRRLLRRCAAIGSPLWNISTVRAVKRTLSAGLSISSSSLRRAAPMKNQPRIIVIETSRISPCDTIETLCRLPRVVRFRFAENPAPSAAALIWPLSERP